MSFLINHIQKHIISVIFGALGFLSAIVTMFIDLKIKVSVVWLIFIILIALILVTLLVSAIIELIFNKNLDNTDIKQLKLKYLNKKYDRTEVFLNSSNIDFDYGDVVKVYHLDDDEIENFIGIGIISHVQTKQKICHIEFILGSTIISPDITDVYFSLKINKDELNNLLERG